MYIHVYIVYNILYILPVDLDDNDHIYIYSGLYVVQKLIQVKSTVGEVEISLM